MSSKASQTPAVSAASVPTSSWEHATSQNGGGGHLTPTTATNSTVAGTTSQLPTTSTNTPSTVATTGPVTTPTTVTTAAS